MCEEGIYIPHFCQPLLHLDLPIEEMPIKYKSKYDRYISLDFFRDLYGEDRKRFNKVVQELALRGSFFNVDRGRGIFPLTFDLEKHELIYCSLDTDDKAYINIDWSIMDLSYIEDYFQIKGNDFYDGIPLSGFKSLNPHIDYKFLRNEVVQAGFIVGNEKEEELNTIGRSVSQLSEKLAEPEHCLINKNEEEIIKNLSFYLEYSFLHSIPLAKIIIQEDCSGLRLVLTEDDITCLGDISEFSYRDSKFSRVECFKNYNNLAKALKVVTTGKSSIPFYQMFLNFLQNTYSLDFNPLLSTLYAENKYIMFKRVAAQNNVQHVTEIDEKLIADFILFPQVGQKKVLDVMEKLYQFYSNFENYREVISDNGKLIEDGNFSQRDPLSSIPFFCLFQDPLLVEWCVEQGCNLIHSENIDTMLDNFKQERMPGKRKTFRSISDVVKKNLTYLRNLKIEQIVPVEEKFDVSLTSILSMLERTYNWSVSLFPEESQMLLQQYEHITFNRSLLCLDLTNNSSLLFLLSYYYQLVTRYLNLKEMFENDLIENEQLVMQERILSQKATLEEVGEMIGVTRERIRQIEVKVRKKLKHHFINNANLLIKVVVGNNEDSLKKLNQLIQSNSFLETLIVQNIVDDYYVYNHNFDIILPTHSPGNIDETLDSISLCLKDLPKIITKQEVVETVILPKTTGNLQLRNYILSILEHVMTSLDYKLVNDFTFLKSKISKHEKIDYIITHTMEGRINLNSSKDRQLFEEEFQKNFPEDEDYIGEEEFERNIPAILDRTEHYIKIESLVYEIFEPKEIPSALFQEIHSFLSRYLTDEVFITSKKLFTTFQEKLRVKDISLYKMYYFLRYLYGEEFSFGRGNTMHIYAKEEYKYSNEELIYRKLIDLGGKVRKGTLIEELGVEEYTIMQTVSKSKKMISNGGLIQATLRDVHSFPLVLKNKIYQLSEEMAVEKGFISVYKIMHKIKFDIDYSEALRTAQIQNEVDLMYILKELLPDYEGHTKFLYKKGCPKENKDLILSELEDRQKYTRGEIAEVGLSFGYADSTMNMITNNLIETGELIPVSEEFLVLQNSIEITDSTLVKVKDYIEKELVERKYLSLFQLVGLRSNLPRIPRYRWKPELLKYCLKLLDYQFAVPDNNTFRTDPFVVVHNHWRESTYYDLVHEELLNYKGNLYKSNVARYLVDKGLLKASLKDEQNLPKDLIYNEVIDLSPIGLVTVL